MRASARVVPGPEVSGPGVTTGSLALRARPLGNVVPSGPVTRCEERKEIRLRNGRNEGEKEPGAERGGGNHQTSRQSWSNVWPPGWRREGASGGAKLWDQSDGRHARRRKSECGLRASAEPRTKVRCHTGPGRVAREAPGSALFRLGSPGRWSAALPPHADGGRGDPEDLRMDH
ncbi:hypothetical protein NDU88_004737 [Pleurodeles waltl]|uniref:Uncharacterized protein n=1 Tax=Pleurodeles waltl TaxID=8319 RepID=A0AAV7SJL9_PLEWA|nr:hypothetical protein NDU88_004737 [Pleurodeles waltl]